MIFPKWVSKPGTTKLERASNRLRYFLGRMSVEHDRAMTLTKLCEKTGYSHSVISLYVTRGKFTPAAATKFEDVFGRDICPNEWLRDPSLIPSGSDNPKRVRVEPVPNGSGKRVRAEP